MSLDLPFFIYPEAFSSESVSKALDIGSNLDLKQAQVNSVNGVVVNKERRYCEVGYITHVPSNDWLYEEIWNIFTYVNEKNWKYPIDSMSQVEFLAYGAGHNINWHRDTLAQTARSTQDGPDWDKILSLTIQLSDAEDYDGGDSQFLDEESDSDADPVVAKEFSPGNPIVSQMRRKRSLIVFPSVLMHRVTEVTRGTRKSLVVWAGGKSVYDLDF